MSEERTVAPVPPADGAGRYARNVLWNVLGALGGKLLGPALHVLIARLLVPADFGVFAVAVAWLAAFELVKDWGLTQSILVARGGTRELRLQFTAQIATALGFCGLTLALAPVVADAFDLPGLALILPLVSLAALADAVADPLTTECLLRQRYRRLALRQVLTPLVGGGTGLLLAWQGHGVHALAVGLLAGNAAAAICLIPGQGSVLRLLWDRPALLELLRLAKHVVSQRAFGFLVGHADAFIIGKLIGPQALGLYRMGGTLASLLPLATVPQAQQVTFTEILERRGEEELQLRYDRFVLVSGVALLAYSIGVYLAAPVLVPAVLGEPWRETVPLLQLFAVAVVTGSLTPMNMDLAKILGFFGTYTWYAAVRSVATVAAIAWAAQYTIMHVATAWVIVGLAFNLANDVIFHAKQRAVRVTPAKIGLIGASWLWACAVFIALFR
jgi:PST family polysaccharide transporter